MFETTLRRSWVILLLLSCAFISTKLINGNSIQTSLFAMFPSNTQTEALDIALKYASGVFEHDLVVVVESESNSAAIDVAKKLVLKISRLPHISFIDSQQRLAFVSELFQHRQQLLTEQDRLSIDNGDTAQLTQSSLRRLYSPAGLNGKSFINDPWQTFEHYVLSLIGSNNFQYQDGLLVANQNGRTQILLQLYLTESAFNSNTIEGIDQLNEVLKQFEVEEQIQLYRTGAGFYSADAMQLAKNEVSIIGGGALSLIVVIVLWLFAHPKPLLMTIFSLCSGVLFGLAATLFWFGEVHVLALVMGSSLIGLSFDYAFHYLSYRLCTTGDLNERAISAHLRPALMMGMLSSVLAYSCLFLANLPILNQMALFSVFGLIGALATVLLCYPSMNIAPNTNRTLVVADFLSEFIRRWFKPQVMFWVVSTYLLVVILAILVGHTDDDVRILQSPDAQLVQQENYIKQLLDNNGGSDWVITLGESAEQVAVREEALTEQLDKLVIQHQLNNYTASTRWVPSQRKQKQNWHSYQRLMDQESKRIANAAGMEGLPVSLPFESFDSLGSYQGIPQLTGQLKDGRHFALLLLNGWDGDWDTSLLGEYQYYLNYVDDIGGMLGGYRQHVTKLLFLAIGSVIILMAVYFGWRNMLRLMTAPILAVLIAAALPAALGLPITLFHVLGLFLIFGIGIDYSVFLLCHGQARHTILAVFVAGISSLLSFGLMALSTNYAIASFGMTVGIGVLSSWLFAPMILLSGKIDE
ncbi:MMPL family transporter [Vibrio sp. MA40-2]|uniref:MMPL family transporter n=1 Tax=Vibrio sp. MA40-2 TaxID=3391828 RepID=UPI0039A71AD2